VAIERARVDPITGRPDVADVADRRTGETGDSGESPDIEGEDPAMAAARPIKEPPARPAPVEYLGSSDPATLDRRMGESPADESLARRATRSAKLCRVEPSARDPVRSTPRSSAAMSRDAMSGSPTTRRQPGTIGPGRPEASTVRSLSVDRRRTTVVLDSRVEDVVVGDAATVDGVLGDVPIVGAEADPTPRDEPTVAVGLAVGSREVVDGVVACVVVVVVVDGVDDGSRSTVHSGRDDGLPAERPAVLPVAVSLARVDPVGRVLDMPGCDVPGLDMLDLGA